MAVDNATMSPSERLNRRIAEHREEMARLEAQGVDPGVELGALLRKRFGLEALRETYAEYRRDGASWLDDEDDADLDGR